MNWDAAPRDVWLVVGLVLAGTCASLVLEAFALSTGNFSAAARAAGIAGGVVFAAFSVWLVLRILVRRRWARILQWWLTLFGILGSALALGVSAALVSSIVDLAWSIPLLVLLSRRQVRDWTPRHPRVRRVSVGRRAQPPIWPTTSDQRPLRPAAEVRLAAHLPLINREKWPHRGPNSLLINGAVTRRRGGLSVRLASVRGVEWTVEDHLRDKSANAVAMYHRFIELVERCGPFTYAVAKTTITLKGTRRGFAGARPTARGLLAGYFDLQRPVSDPRVIRVSPCTGCLYVHQFRVSAIDELDDRFAALLCEAYQVGAGAHIS